jgi:hypothetical protein
MAKITKFQGRAVEDHGETVCFTLGTDDGAHEFECAYGELPALVAGLQACGQAALQAKKAGPFGAMLSDTASPLQVRGEPRLGKTHDGRSVVVQFGTTQGVPVMVSMDNNQAALFATKLLSLARSARPAGGH